MRNDRQALHLIEQVCLLPPEALGGPERHSRLLSCSLATGGNAGLTCSAAYIIPRFPLGFPRTSRREPLV